MNITDSIRANASRTPDAPAYLTDDRPPLSFRDVEALIDAIARRLLDANVRPGQRVGISLHRDLAFVVTAFALARIGAVGFTSKSPDDPCDLRLVSKDGEASRHAPTITADRSWWQVPPPGAAGAPLALHPGGEALCHIFHTSGTTGRPKALGLTHDEILRRAERRRAAFGMPEGTRMLSKVRPAASYGFQSLMRVIADGGAIVDAPAIEDLAAVITRHRVTFLVTPPGILSTAIAMMRPDQGPFPSLQMVEVAGSRMSEQLGELAARRVCPTIVAMYGSTEAGLIALGDAKELRGRPGAVGRIVPGAVAEIVDDAGRPLPPDTEGTLRLRVEEGQDYLDGDATSSAFRDGWFYSGDLGRITADRMLVIAGRADERINVGGGKITPEEIEQAALQIPGVADAAAFAVPSRVAEIERVAMAIVTGPEFDFAAFQQRCRDALGVYAPETVLQMKAIPRNENGKVDRRALKELAASHVPPRAS